MVWNLPYYKEGGELQKAKGLGQAKFHPRKTRGGGVDTVFSHAEGEHNNFLGNLVTRGLDILAMLKWGRVGGGVQKGGTQKMLFCLEGG